MKLEKQSQKFQGFLQDNDEYSFKLATQGIQSQRPMTTVGTANLLNSQTGMRPAS